MLVKSAKKITLARILAAVLILIGIISVELAWGQERTEERTQRDEINLPKQKTVEGLKKVRNPFLFPPGVYLPSKGSPVSTRKEGAKAPVTKPLEIESLPLKVRAILISDHLRLATIDRFVVTVGDTIRGERVLEIKNDRVILGKGDKKRTLPLYQSPVKLTTEKER